MLASMFAYEHRAFQERVARPARVALSGQHLCDWIEDTAVGLTQANGDCVALHPAAKAAFALKDVSVRAYEKNMRWRASIKLSRAGHELQIMRVQARSHRALIAHELGHALLYNQENLWEKIGKSKLIVDPAQERLVDDIARALLIPRAQLTRTPEIVDDPVLFSESLRLSVEASGAPVKIAIARVLALNADAPMSVIYVSIPLQGELFPSRVLAPMRWAKTKSLITYRPWHDRVSGDKYPFLDSIKIEKRLEDKCFSDELTSLPAGSFINRETAERLVRRVDHRTLTRHSQFMLLGTVVFDDVRHLAILCK